MMPKDIKPALLAHFARFSVLPVLLPLCGCFHLGPHQLQQDTVDYSQALGDSQNQATLLNVVRIRYADSPSFLQTTQIISSYQLQQTISAGVEAYPNASTSAGNYVSGGLSAQYNQNPTFTLQPISGQQFAESFIRPLSPAELIPLVSGGIPVDILFRLDVQSINGLDNAQALGGNNNQGSPLFFLLLHDLRALQIAGLLDGSLEDVKPALSSQKSGADAPGASGKPPAPAAQQTVLSFGATTDPALSTTEDEVRQLLGLKKGSDHAVVAYGTGAPSPGQIVLQTRPMLGILNQLAIQVDVPQEDVTAGLTRPTVGNVGIETRPIVAIRSGKKAPGTAFVSAHYRHTWFWIDNDDFDSKLAFSVVQTLLSLAQTPTAPGAVVTIPAN